MSGGGLGDLILSHAHSPYCHPPSLASSWTPCLPASRGMCGCFWNPAPALCLHSKAFLESWCSFRLQVGTFVCALGWQMFLPLECRLPVVLSVPRVLSLLGGYCRCIRSIRFANYCFLNSHTIPVTKQLTISKCRVSGFWFKSTSKSSRERSVKKQLCTDFKNCFCTQINLAFNSIFPQCVGSIPSTPGCSEVHDPSPISDSTVFLTHPEPEPVLWPFVVGRSLASQ